MSTTKETESAMIEMHARSLNAYGETRPDRVWTVAPADFTETVNLTVYDQNQAVIRRNFFDADQARKLGKALIAAADWIGWPDTDTQTRP